MTENKDQQKFINTLQSSLLDKYKIFADIKLTDGSSDPASCYFCSQAQFNSAVAQIFMSSEFAGTILNCALRNPNAEITPLNKLTPAINSVLQPVCSTVWEKFFAAFYPQTRWHVLPLKIMHTLVPDGNFGIEISSGGKLLINFSQEHDNIALPLTLEAVVRQKDISPDQLADLKSGDFIPLGVEKNHKISILLGKHKIFNAKLGQKSNKMAVKITEEGTL